jgi:hypothetical protein
MTKFILALIAAFLLVPDAALAGSAASTWDLTVGGYVRFDMGYSNGGRHGYGAFDSTADKYGNINLYSGATRLNFLIKGHDAWGAKTSAFVEGDFNGVFSGRNRGTFDLRHAFISLDWPLTRVVIGQTFAKWGYLPTYANMIVGGSDLSPFVKGHRQPMVRIEQRLGFDWIFSFALLSPTNTLGSNRSNTPTGVVDGFTQSQMPFYEATLGWSSDRYGNIGPWKALFSIDAFYGQEKKAVTRFAGPESAPTSISATNKSVDSWGIALKGFIPVISERKGNKAGALSLSGVTFVGQNPAWLQSGAFRAGSYSRPGDTNSAPSDPSGEPAPDFAAPVFYGVWGQVSYFLTDRLFINAWYGYLRNDTSRAYDSAGNAFSGAFAHANVVQNTTQYIVSLCYDVNQAIRFAAEYSYYITRYANYGTVPDPLGSGALIPVLSKDAAFQAFRLGAWYFF